MVKKINLVKELSKFKKDIEKIIPLDKMIFFGSRTKKGKNYSKYSDVDLVLVSPKFRKIKFRKRPLSLWEYWRLDIPFDFLCYTPEEFKKRRQSPSIIKEAIKEGIEIK